MIESKRHKLLIALLFVLVPVFLLIHLKSGPTKISIEDLFRSVFNFDSESQNQQIVRYLRVPRAIISIVAGAGLSIAGLLMQTLFNNPLAGPYVLGINSGASLFVAFSIMTGIPFFLSDYGIILNALIGAFLFGVLILFFTRFVRNHITLLLIGLMLGYFTSAFVSILQVASEAQQLKLFALWSMGSLEKVQFGQLGLILVVFLAGIFWALMIVKPLNILVTGENHARLLGVNVIRIRILIITITALFTGIITAYCGPIAFVGLAVPNLVRILFKTQNHRTLIAASAIIGSSYLMLVDIIIQLFEPMFRIPINAFTSIIGAPIVVLLLLKRIK